MPPPAISTFFIFFALIPSFSRSSPRSPNERVTEMKSPASRRKSPPGITTSFPRSTTQISASFPTLEEKSFSISPSSTDPWGITSRIRLTFPFAKVSTSRADGIWISLTRSEAATCSGLMDIDSPSSSFRKYISSRYWGSLTLAMV